jgi:uncharacterized membrane protein YfcA
LSFLLLYCGIGAVSGILAGLLGMGGGIVIVPMLTYLFTAQQLSAAYTLHLALGTSLASIIFTSLSSVRAHHGRGAVEWPMVRRISPGIVAGGLIGTWVAAQLSSSFLKGCYVLFLFFVSWKLLRNVPTAPRKPAGAADIFGAGTLIGGVSSLVGIGGGTMTVPFMLRCNVSMHNAIGTSAAVGFPIAVAGAIGYALSGLKAASLPAYCLGFIYLPALLGIALVSILTAPIGAKLAHSLPVPRLKKVFACLLLLVATKMMFSFL